MSKVIKVGIAGFGRSGYGIHANCLKQKTDKFKVVAVADQLPERRQDAVNDFGCEVFADYQDMLAKADFDLFINATPSRFHVEASLAALAAGRNLLSEKPSATCVEDFDKIVAAANKAKVMFYPFQNSRFYPFFMKMQEILKSGVLGDIVAIRSNWSNFARRWDWQTLQEECAGNLFNTGPHPVDQAVALFGDGEPEVFARMYANHWGLGGDAENYVSVTLYGPGKPNIEVVISSLQAYPQGEMYNISGTLGGLTGGPSGLKWKYFKPEEAPKQDFWKPWSQDRKYCSEQLAWNEETWVYNDQNSNATGFVGMVHALYNNLYDVMVNGAAQVIKHEEVRKQVRIMQEAHRQNPLPRNKK
jgi:predicted dehydrogenase